MTDFSSCPDVRLAVPEDIPELLKVMREACLEDAQHEMDEEKVMFMIMRHFNKQGVMIAVIGDIGHPVAYVLSVLDSIWYSQDWQLLELSLFVSENHRKSTYAKQLIQFLKASAEGLGLPLTTGVFSHKRTEAKVRLYQRNLPQVGAFFCFTPSTANTNA